MSVPSASDIESSWKAVEEAQAMLAARLSAFKELFARVPVSESPPRHVCPVATCGIARPSADALADHLENVHGIVEP